jgi:outer membrane protein, heavy metal efflux system
MRVVMAAVLCVCLMGCVGVPSDRGFSVSRELINARSAVAGNAIDPATSLPNDVLSKPLTVDDAVRVALARNAKIKTLYSDLGVSQAEVYEATHISNPSVGYSRISGDGSARTQWSISQSLTELLFMRYRASVGRSQLLQTQQRVARDILDLETQVRLQYFRYLGASAIAKLHDQLTDTTAVAARYAKQLHDAGNISALQLSREQAAASEAQIEQQRAKIEALSERTALLNLLALSTSTATIQFVEELSQPLTIGMQPDALQRWSLTNRLDLLAAREDLGAKSTTMDHARWWSWFGGMTVGVERETEQPNGRQSETRTGPTASIEVPLFNHGTGRKLLANAEFEKAQSRIAVLELSISNEVLLRYAALQSASNVVEIYRDQLSPLRQRIVTLEQERQSFMLIGLPELLIAKREQIEAERDYLAALRDYWIEVAQLQRALGGMPSGLLIQEKVAP